MAVASLSTRIFKGFNRLVQMYGAVGDGSTDTTSALLAAFIPSGGDGSNVERKIPTGTYLVTPGSLLIPNPQSGVLHGSGSRFNSVIKSNDALSTSSILTLGDGVWEPHNFTMRDLAIDADYGSPASGALYFDRTNLMRFYNITVQHIGAAGIAMGSNPSAPLFGEMIFHGCKVYSGDAGVPAGSIGVRFYPTGNIDFEGSSIENFTIGAWLSFQNQVSFYWFGGHLERISDYCLILENCQPTVFCDRVTGGIYLDNATINGRIELAANSGAWTNGAIVDCGFGNRIRVPSSQLFQPGDKAAYSTGLNFDGTEWLNVANLNDDPTFLNGAADWSAGGGATLSASTISMPGVKSGKSLLITDGGGGSGYAERTFTATANTDYLLQVGLLVRGTQHYRITVSDSGGVVWDSGSFTYGLSVAEWQSFKVIRKRIPVTADTVFKVRIYSVDAAQVTIVPMVLISQSQMRMSANYATTGTGFSTSGSGASYAWTQDTNTGSVYTSLGTTLKGRCFVRAVVSMSAGKSGAIGIGGDGNSKNAGPIIPLRAGTDVEYIVPLANYPETSVVKFYSFSGVTNNLTIKEVGIYPINDASDQIWSLTDGWMRTDSGSGVSTLSTSQSKLWLGNNENANWQAASSAGNSFTRAIYASNIYWDETGGNWVIPNNGAGDWAAILLLNSGEIGLACESGLVLPTTRTNTQVMAAIKAKITPTSLFQVLTGQLDFISGTDQAWLRIYNGDPNGSITAVVGSVCFDPSGNLWLKTGGGFGNTGWVQLVTAGSVVTSLTAGTGIAVSAATGAVTVSLSQPALSALISGNLSLTTSYQDVPNLSLSLNKDGLWEVTMAVNCSWTTNDGGIRVGLNYNGSIISGEEAYYYPGNPPSGADCTISYTWYPTVSGQPKTAKVQAKKVSGTGTSSISSLFGGYIRAKWLHA